MNSISTTLSNPEPQNAQPVASQFQELKKLDEMLDTAQQAKAEAQQLYQDTLQQFATLCHQLWQQERAPGNHQGKGFRHKLKDSGINAGRAYRAMKKFFPADFPAKKPVVQPSAVSVRFTHRRNGNKAGEFLECSFALTPEEKAEFQRCLKLVGAQQVQRLLLDSVKQAAETLEAKQAEKQNPEPRKDKKGKKYENAGKNGANAARELLPRAETAQQSQPLPHNDSPLTSQHAAWRMNRLWEKLQLQGTRPDLQPLAMQFNLQKVQNRLDWIDANPEWCSNLKGKTTSEFVYALQLLFF